MTDFRRLAGSPRILIPLLCVMITVALVLAFRAFRPVPPETTALERTWPVRSVIIQAAERAPQLRLLGRVETPFRATLTSAVTADVASIEALEGARVEAGDPILTLDDADVKLVVAQRQADIAELEAQQASERNQHQADRQFLEREKALVAIASRALAREQRLTDSNLSSESRTDQARQALQTAELSLVSRELAVANHQSRLQGLSARLDRARALLQQARLDLKRTRLEAPFTGVITAIEVSPGDRVSPGRALASLYSVDRLEVRAQLPVHWTAEAQRSLAAGRPLTATGSIAGQEYNLSLERLSGRVNPGAGGVDGLFRFLGDKPPAALNQTLELLLELAPNPHTFALPVPALYDSSTVYRVADGRLESVPVTLVGDRFDQGRQRLLVQSPELNDGDHILATQLPNAINGLKVDVIEPEPVQ